MKGKKYIAVRKTAHSLKTKSEDASFWAFYEYTEIVELLVVDFDKAIEYFYKGYKPLTSAVRDSKKEAYADIKAFLRFKESCVIGKSHE